MRLALPARLPAFTLAPRRRGAAERQNVRVAALLGTGVVAAGAFGALAVASARRVTVAPDERTHAAMRARLDDTVGDAAEPVAAAVGDVGKWWVYVPAALAAATAVLVAPARAPARPRARRVGAAAIAVVPTLATALSPAFDRWLPQPPVGPRRRPVDHPVFPSGHAFRATAVALTAGYVVARERVARAGGAASFAALVPALVGAGRLVREKHLASDVIGGWLAGIALAAAAVGTYELARAPRHAPARRRRRV